jgi:hypothetical protein
MLRLASGWTRITTPQPKTSYTRGTCSRSARSVIDMLFFVCQRLFCLLWGLCILFFFFSQAQRDLENQSRPSSSLGSGRRLQTSCLFFFELMDLIGLCAGGFFVTGVGLEEGSSPWGWSQVSQLLLLPFCLFCCGS